MTLAALAIDDQHTTRAAAYGDSLARYLNEIGRYRLLTRAEETRLARGAAAGDPEAKRRLVEANLRLVVSIARRYQGLGIDMLDLIQEGNLGLMAAADRYDWQREASFATYASWWIRRAICKALSTNSRLIRLPQRLAEATTNVRRAEQALAQRLGRRPTLAEVANEAQVDEDTVADLRRAELAPVSLDEPFGEDEADLEELLADEHCVDPGSVAADADDREVAEALSTLPASPRRVLELRYGLDGNDPRSLDQTAGELGLSRERVRQLESRSLRQLAARADLQSFRSAA